MNGESGIDRRYLRVLSHFQKKLSVFVVGQNRLAGIGSIAGVDVFYSSGTACACACVLKYPSCEVMEKVIVKDKEIFPYISGYLMFREGPVVLKAVSSLQHRPDCIIIDGNGKLHPYGMGLASFVGVFLQIPAIGCSKTLALGKYSALGTRRGDFSFIYYGKKKMGMALRTQDGVREVFISVGWGVNLLYAKDIILDVCRYRIPEPLRCAHMTLGSVKVN